MIALRKFWIALIFSGLSVFAFAQHGEPQHPQQASEHPAAAAQTEHSAEQSESAAHDSHGCGHSLSEEAEFNAGENAVHHIADANAIHIFGDTYLHLPCILNPLS